MTKVINCECGFVVRGNTDEELVVAAQRHALDVHGMQITGEQALALAEPV